MSTHSELVEAPDVVAGLLERAGPSVAGVAAAVRDRDVDLVMIAARG